jgi:hypothetical protein
MTEKRQHICIAIPCYTGKVDMGTMASLIAELPHLSQAGINVTFADQRGNSMISHGRDMLLAQFLASDATDIFFIDDDVTWDAGSLTKLMSWPVDVVAGVYPTKTEPIYYHTRFLSGDLKSPEGLEGLLEVEAVPAGFLRISRLAVEQMVLNYPEKRFADKNAPKGYAWALFDNIHEGDLYFGEDYSFCRRYRAIGGKIYVQPEIVMGHVGPKVFMGSFGHWLRSRDKPEA